MFMLNFKFYTVTPSSFISAVSSWLGLDAQVRSSHGLEV